MHPMAKVTEADLWNEARRLVARHGADAPLYALQTADQFAERGDLVLARRWQRVMRAARELVHGVDSVPN